MNVGCREFLLQFHNSPQNGNRARVVKCCILRHVNAPSGCSFLKVMIYLCLLITCFIGWKFWCVAFKFFLRRCQVQSLAFKRIAIDFSNAIFCKVCHKCRCWVFLSSSCFFLNANVGSGYKEKLDEVKTISWSFFLMSTQHIWPTKLLSTYGFEPSGIETQQFTPTKCPYKTKGSSWILTNF